MQWFPSQRYLAVGITSAGASAGGVAYPPIISLLISKFGFLMGVRVHAAVIGGISFIVILLGRPNPESTKRPLKNISKLSEWIDITAYRNWSFVLLTLATCFVFFGFSPMLFHVTEWAEQEKLGVTWFLSILNGCSMVGRIGSSIIASCPSNILNPQAIHCLSCFSAAVLVTCLWPLADERADALGFCVGFGILAGAMVGLPASCVARIIPNDKYNSLGVWTGIMWSSCCVFAFSGPPIAGVLHKQFGIKSVGMWAGANLLIASLLSLAALVFNMRNDKKRLGSSDVGKDQDQEIAMSSIGTDRTSDEA